MTHAEALKIAEEVLALLKPHCVRAEIAGSIRRLKPEVKDIEIVAIPYPYENDGLFVTGIAEIVNQWDKVIGKLGPKCRYTQRILPQGIKLDLFFAERSNFGWIMALRTGSAEFNFKYLEAIKNRNLKTVDGHIYNEHHYEEAVPEEQDFFDLIGMKYLPPNQRI